MKNLTTIIFILLIFVFNAYASINDIDRGNFGHFNGKYDLPKPYSYSIIDTKENEFLPP